MQEVVSNNHAAAQQDDAGLKEQLAFLLLALAVTVAIALGYNALDFPLIGDSQHYFYMSERVASGVSPYPSHFDPKPAASLLLTGGAIYIGRIVGMPDVIAARLISLLVLAVSGWTAWRLTRYLTRSPKVAVLAFLAIFAFAGFVEWSVISSRPKVFLVMFMLLTMLFFAQGRFFWAGLSAALAFLTWQPALILMGILVFVLLLYPGRWRNIGYALLGAVVPLLIYQSYFVITDSVQEQLTQTFYFPAVFMNNAFLGILKSPYHMVRIWIKGFGLINILPWICAFGIVVYGLRYFSSSRAFSLPPNISPGWLYIILCMLVSVAFTYYDHQGPVDLFFLLPFIAVIAAYTLNDQIEQRFSRRRTSVYGLALTYLVALIVLGPYHRPPKYQLSDQVRLANEVKQMMDANETVYAIGNTHLLALNNSENWMKYGFFFRGVDEFILAEETGGETFVPLKNGKLPSVVLLSRIPPRGSEQWLFSKYTDIELQGYDRQRVQVFKLTETSEQTVNQ